MLDANTDFRNRHLADDEEIVAKTIHHLQFDDPANANREYAIQLLKLMERTAKKSAGVSTLSFEEYVARYNELLKSKK